MSYYHTRKRTPRRKLQKNAKTKQLLRESSKETSPSSISAPVEISDRLIPPWLFLESTSSNSTSSNQAPRYSATTELVVTESSPIESTPHDTFWQFRRLPKELRLRIFGLALPEEEFIHVEEIGGLDEKLSPLLGLFGLCRRHFGKEIMFDRLSAPPPYLESVSTEAREVVMRRYPFKLPTLTNKAIIRFGPQDFISLENIEDFADNLFLRHSLGNEVKANDWLMHVQNLIVPACYGPQSNEIWSMWSLLSLFENLHTVRFALLSEESRHLLSQLEGEDLIIVGRMSKYKKLKMYKRVLKRGLSAGIYTDQLCGVATTFCWNEYRDMEVFLREGMWAKKWRPEIEFVGLKDDWHEHHMHFGDWHTFDYDYRPLHRVFPDSIIKLLITVTDFVEGYLRIVVCLLVLLLCLLASILVARA